MIEFLRQIKSVLQYFSQMQFMGFHIDVFFHFAGGFFGILLLQLIFSLRQSVWIMIFLMVLKEAADVLAKSRLEYIRPPTIDLLYDLTFGFLGICLAYFLFRRRKNQHKASVPAK